MSPLDIVYIPVICPKCKHDDTQVLDSRDCPDGVRRRRKCLSCENRFTTYERCEVVNVAVLKKDGSRERFNPEKIRKGVAIACKNRPVTQEAIDQLVEQVEQALILSGKEILTSQEIGKLVEPLLRALDEIAFVRFVSVSQSFTDVNQFSEAIDALT